MEVSNPRRQARLTMNGAKVTYREVTAVTTANTKAPTKVAGKAIAKAIMNSKPDSP